MNNGKNGLNRQRLKTTAGTHPSLARRSPGVATGRRYDMILNDTLQKHEDCLEQCELQRVVCQLDQENDGSCDLELKFCRRDCEFDYGP